MGHGFGLVEERPELVWAAYGVAVAPTVRLFERGRWDLWESEIPGVEAHTAPETLTWFSPPVVTFARVVAAGKSKHTHTLSLSYLVKANPSLGISLPMETLREPEY
ncbi:unnamed protein product [Schistocephalus solidus]|uniref:Alpha-galactosidase n=1 Tax=Schistocephalus solidus TaxID=70667 RepID=A0A183ST54_SCHSO|nr:unnamed protein product [Schistocephalus solidus]